MPAPVAADGAFLASFEQDGDTEGKEAPGPAVASVAWPMPILASAIPGPERKLAEAPGAGGAERAVDSGILEEPRGAMPALTMTDAQEGAETLSSSPRAKPVPSAGRPAETERDGSQTSAEPSRVYPGREPAAEIADPAGGSGDMLSDPVPAAWRESVPLALDAPGDAVQMRADADGVAASQTAAAGGPPHVGGAVAVLGPGRGNIQDHAAEQATPARAMSAPHSVRVDGAGNAPFSPDVGTGHPAPASSSPTLPLAPSAQSVPAVPPVQRPDRLGRGPGIERDSLDDAPSSGLAESVVDPDAQWGVLLSEEKPVPNPGFWERLFNSVANPLAQSAPMIDEGSASGESLTASDPASPPTDASRAIPATAVSGAARPAAPLRPVPPDGIGLTPDLPRDESRDGLLTALGSALAAASAPSHASAAPPQGTASLPVPQVTAQITAALSQSADGATELALSPEELGHVRLRLEPDTANPDRMVVTMTFERPETLDLFRRHAGELADALRAAGYAGADIGFGQGGGGSNGSDRTAGQPAAQDMPDLAPPPSAAPRLAAGASLDLRL